MKKLLGTMFVLLVAFSIQAQKKSTPQISGKVQDSLTGKPVEGAVIWLGKRAALTDATGFFSMDASGIPTSEFSIAATGYTTLQVKLLNSSLSNSLHFLLVPESNLLQPLEVTAVRAAATAPFAKTNINKEQIKKMNLGMDIPMLLNQVPSVVVNADAGNGVGYTGIRIRGSDATRINVTLNGVPYNDAESMGTFFVNLPDFSSSVTSIQVQRGVGTSTNGPAAFGASIHLSTNDLHEKPYTELNNTVGSFGTLKNTILGGTGLLGKHFTIDGRLSRIVSNGYIERASSNLQSFYVSTLYKKNKSSIRLNVFSGKEKTYQAWYGVPENLLGTNRTYNPAGTEKPGTPYNNQTDNYWQTHYQLFFNQTMKNNWSINTTSFVSTGKGYYEEYKADQSFSKYGLPSVTLGGTTYTATDLIRQKWLDNIYFGQLFTLQQKTDKREITIGGGITRYDGKHFGQIPWLQYGTVPAGYRYYHFSAYKNDAHMYAKWQENITNRWKLFADLQYRFVRHVMNGFQGLPNLNVNRPFSFLNPKMGLNYQHNGTNAFFSYAVANKEPNRDDFQAGISSQPNAETLHDWEAGWMHKSAKGYYGVTAFYMLYQQQLVLTGQINDVGAYTRTNVPNSYRMGLEWEGGWQFNQQLQLSGNVSISRNKIKEFTEYIDNFDTGDQQAVLHRNTDISFSPAVTGAGIISWKPFAGIELEWIHKYVSKQYLDNSQSELRKIQPFYVQDIRASWKIPVKALKECKLIVQIINLMNKQYEPNGYTYPYIFNNQLTADNAFYPMAGRNILIALNISL
ncbi:MAG: TonB-dependent receptor plug domain-containing protein [Chitinophagia bacterium]|jgi:iron complex outermembrane receptor protein